MEMPTSSPAGRAWRAVQHLADKDTHSQAFATLTKPKADKLEAYPNLNKIGPNLKIADVTKSDRCLSCHALSVPADKQGKQFNIKEGNSCNSCHGPSSAWLDPHQAKGWTDGSARARPIRTCAADARPRRVAFDRECIRRKSVPARKRVRVVQTTEVSSDRDWPRPCAGRLSSLLLDADRATPSSARDTNYTSCLP